MKYISPLIMILILVASCKQELPPNPYDDIKNSSSDSTQSAKVDSASFVSLHKFIFKATCANAGCHDGTFEPDFRTLESAYNTLVYHPIIKNDQQGTYTYRVTPFDPDKSVLLTRLTVDIDGISGIMPLSVDPDSDYLEKREEYISYIRKWIADGAPNMFGELPTKGNQEPEMRGVVAFDGNNQLLERQPGNGSIKVPEGTSSITVWFALKDDSTAANVLGYNKIKLSTTRDDFSGSSEKNLLIAGNAITEDDYFGNSAQYYHKFTVQNPGSFGGVGTKVFFRIYVKDPQHDITEIPEVGSFKYIKSYFSFEIVQ